MPAWIAVDMSIVVVVVGSMQVQLDIAARKVDRLVRMTVEASAEVDNLVVVKEKVSDMRWTTLACCCLS